MSATRCDLCFEEQLNSSEFSTDYIAGHKVKSETSTYIQMSFLGILTIQAL